LAVVKETKAKYPNRQVEVFAFDEHRVGLQPILRRVWAKKGEPTTVKIDPHFEWIWVYTFVNPQKGETYWLILPTVNIPLFNLALAEFATSQKVGRDKIIILVIDRAGFHAGDEIKIPDGIITVFLPSYSPELQPAEKLWPLSNEGIANRSFKDLDELEEKQIERIQTLLNQKEIITAETLFHWWPRV